MAMNSSEPLFDAALDGDRRALAKLLTIAEEGGPVHAYDRKPSWILGITGPPGAGKSTLIDRLASSWSEKGETIAILAVDPSSPVSGGALLGDRARMVFSDPSKIYFRSVSSRGSSGGISNGVRRMVEVLQSLGWDRILIETVGAGQGEFAIASVADRVMLVEGPDRGDILQAEKAGILEIADIIACNKSDLPGSQESVNSIKEGLSLSEGAPEVISVSALKGSGLDDLMESLDRITPNPDRLLMRSSMLLDSILADRMRRRPVYEDAMQALASRAIGPDEAADMVEFGNGRV
ncbi:MAG: GTP-binding protein [Candidatus Thermoplasmatota archaeon]|nr:GTP-binding protein [Candidatus Thermoplasmatota archaeon]